MLDPQAVTPATDRDIPRMAEIRAAVRENRLSDPASVSPGDYRRYIDAGTCWVWRGPDGAIAGFAALDAAAGSVWALFVAPEADGQGGGRLLLAHLVGEARRAGLARLTLETSPGTRAEHIYRAAGWQVTATAPDGTLHLALTL